MDFIYYLSTLLFVGIFGATVVGLIKPKAFRKQLNQHATRKNILALGVSSILILGIVIGISEPENLKQARIDKQKTSSLSSKSIKNTSFGGIKTETKNIQETQQIDFSEEQTTDSLQASGQTKIIREGRNGQKIVTYEVKYEDGVEVSRVVKSETITVSPISQITSIGTYTPPANSSGGYINSQGNYVSSPSSDPNGATARCNDGTYSYSQSRRGTCSHHGGVAVWY